MCINTHSIFTPLITLQRCMAHTLLHLHHKNNIRLHQDDVYTFCNLSPKMYALNRVFVLGTPACGQHLFTSPLDDYNERGMPPGQTQLLDCSNLEFSTLTTCYTVLVSGKGQELGHNCTWENWSHLCMRRGGCEHQLTLVSSISLASTQSLMTV